jgi:site-specific recombinase XerD
LKRLFSYLSRFRHIPRDPACAIELPKNPRGLPTSNIKEREVQLLLESVSTENPLGLRDRAILETLYSTGVRNKELRYVKAQDIDFEMGLLRVNNPKGGALYQRVIAIGKTALYWVQQYLRKSRPLLLKWRNGERGNGEGGIGETFVNKSFPKPFQKTLTGSHAVLGTACDQKKLRKKSYPPVTASDQKTLTGEKVLNGEKALNGKNFKMQHWRESDYLFLNKAGGQMSATGLLGVVKNALLRARIRNPSIVTHSFRVACATGMLKGKGQSMKGADIKWVQEQLGHTNIQSTSKYLRLVPGELKRIHTLYHPRESSRKVPPKTTKTNL